MILHELEDFSELIEVTAGTLNIDPGLIEKDYWIMHGLCGLQQLGMDFELKGGTSLSKDHQLNRAVLFRLRATSELSGALCRCSRSE